MIVAEKMNSKTKKDRQAVIKFQIIEVLVIVYFVVHVIMLL